MRADLDLSVDPCGQANANSIDKARSRANRNSGQGLTAIADVDLGFVAAAAGDANAAWRVPPRGYGMSAKEMTLQKELRVGQGPVCWPGGVRAEVLERIRLREEARAKTGTRSP